MQDLCGMDRRGFLRRLGHAALAASVAPAALSQRAFATAALQELEVTSRTIEVGGKAARVFGISGANGRPGLEVDRARGFHVRMRNGIDEPTVVHWHGLTPPFPLDGTLESQRPLLPQEAQEYAFALDRAGTYWMHSHMGLQEQLLLAAPLIVREDGADAVDRQEVVVLLHDFTFTPPAEILASLRSGEGGHVGSGTAAIEMGTVRAPAAMPGMGGAGTDGTMPGMAMDADADVDMSPGMDMDPQIDMDLNDVALDAFLANDRDLTDPEVVRVDRGGRVRLRIINGASATNFWIDLGALAGELVAVDGQEVRPIRGSRFEIAMAQRLDIEVTMPQSPKALPILAQREGDRARTGIILATPGAEVAKLGAEADMVAPPVLLALERRLAATEPLAQKPADRAISTALTGSMTDYRWGMDGRVFEDRVPLEIRAGERVEITMVNRTMMSHPMHLHGHHFQVVGIGQARLAGALRDTVLVPAMDSVTIAFDADNPGAWPLHCHNLYHRAAGMMTTVNYV